VQPNNRNHELVQPRRGGRGTSGNRVKDEAKKYAEKWSEEEHANAHTWWTDGSQSDDGRVGAAAVCGDSEGGWKVLRSYVRK